MISQKNIFLYGFGLLLTLFFVSSQALAQSQKTGGEARLEAWKQHQSMAATSPFKDGTWQTLGPKFAGGRIESIDAPRGDRSTIYAGVGAGGIWKTENGGLTWRPIFDKQSTFAIGDLTIAPSNPDTIWVGTGECHLSRTSYPGNGVFKSVDAGETWTHMGLPDSAHIGKVVIDPENENLVYVAAMGRSDRGGQRGIFKTTDGGASFDRVLFDGERVAFVDLVIDPHDSSRLFATSWDRSGQGRSAVFRSEDHGETWERLSGGLLENQVDRIALDVAASQPGVVYTMMCDASSPELAKRKPAAVLFRSNDHGETWHRAHEDYLPTYVGWDFCDLRIAPDDANRVYVGGLRLITSIDGGKTFQGEGGFAVNRDPQNVFRLHAHRGIGMHLDVHDIWIDPEDPQRVMLGNDGGLYVSWNRGQTWLHLNNLPIAEFYRVHLDQQTPFRIWGGTQDNASFVAPSEARFVTGGDDAWQQVFLDPWSGGDGFSTFPDPLDPQITYYTQQNGDLKRSRLGQLRPEKSIRPRSKNTAPYAGAADPEKPKGKEKSNRLNFAWDTPFLASSQPGDTVLYCAAQCVLRSKDRGDTWTRISPDFGSRGLLALTESPQDAKRLAVGGGRGNVQITSDSGRTWKATEGLPKKVVRDILCCPHDANRIYVALSGKPDHDPQAYLFMSEDFGQTWQKRTGGLPAESINTLAADSTRPGVLFAGTDLGVYVSLNHGETWHSLCHSLPTAPVVDLAVHGKDAALVAATHGLGMFLLDISPIQEAASQQK